MTGSGEKKLPEEKIALAHDVIWNLGDLYQLVDDPQIESDIRECETRASSLEQTYKGRIAELPGEELKTLVKSLEALDVLQGRLATYAFLYFTTRTADPAASALLQRIEELTSQTGRRTVFFRLEWNRLPQSQANTLLHSEELASYHHYLSVMRTFAPHQLSDSEEELLQELGPIGRSAWLTLFEKIMGQIKFGDDERTEEEVLSELYHPEREVRKKAAADLTDGLRRNLHILTHIFNTLAAEKSISDRLRRYGSWISAMNLENELDVNTVDALISAVTSRYDIVQRYYRLKAKLLGLDELYDYDRYAPVTGLDTALVSWQQCKSIVLESFAEFSPRMADIAERFFTGKWIHAPVGEGKRGGAFAHPCVPGIHPYIMVNYTGNLRDVSTVAHELGHGIHQYLATGQGYYNSDTPLVLAETASVFAELLVFKAQLRMLQNSEARRAFICQKLESIFATVFRQVSMNRFEEKMHNGRRQQGELSAAVLSHYWLESQELMFGDSVVLSDDYSVWWSYIPHFLSTPGYVYSYAFGELLVLALYNLYQKQGDAFVDKYLALLAAGGCETPYDLLQSFAIDLTDSSFWLGGLEVIEQMLHEVE